jgi:hypothetical protein
MLHMQARLHTCIHGRHGQEQGCCTVRMQACGRAARVVMWLLEKG